MLALFDSLSPLEIGVILIAAVMIFGRDLPRVAAELFVKVRKVKSSLGEMWRETGMDQEIRRLRTELDDVKRGLPRDIDPAVVARDLTRRIEAEERREPAALPAPKPPVTPPPEPDSGGTEREPRRTEDTGA